MLYKVNNKSNLNLINNISYKYSMNTNIDNSNSIDEKLSSFGKRLKIAMDLRKVNQKQLVNMVLPLLPQKIPISQPAISQAMKRGGSKYSYQFALALEVDPEWLINGTGIDPLTEKKLKPGVIPIVDWDDIPKIHLNPSKIGNYQVDEINITFFKEKNIFISKIPEEIIPGEDSDLFNPRDNLLISPLRPPEHNLPVIISSKSYPVPEYAIYKVEFGKQYLKFKGQRYYEYNKKDNTFLICGVVVARLNIFI